MMALLQSRGSVEGKGAHKGVDLGRTVGVFFLFWFLGFFVVVVVVVVFKKKKKRKKSPAQGPARQHVCVCTHMHIDMFVV